MLILLLASACAEPVPIFREAGAEAGLDFVHFNGMSGELYFPEIAGAGGALADFDNDGDLDLYAVQGRMLGETPLEKALIAPHHPPPLVDRLYRNDLVETGDGPRLSFTDITSASGLKADGYGMGVATGDYDNDGWVDLYVTNFGANQLWRNLGVGPDGNLRFADVTSATGTGDEGWGNSATFFDYDRDGWLDLYVANYVRFRLANHKTCRDSSGRPDYCGPSSYLPAPDRLYRNLGRGADGVVRFEDVSGRAGIHAEVGAGLGVVAADFDRDGWVDLYVANDQMPNFLWRNEGDGRFSNQAVLAGAAVNVRGQAEASMGVATGDFDNDGDDDVFLTHLSGETNTVYLNLGDGIFEDRSSATGVGPPSLRATGFGTALLDFDNDGWLDLLAANGAVYRRDGFERPDSIFPYEQPNMLYRNRGDGSFEDVSAQAGEVFALAEVSRGLAVGDLDNDGDVDAVVFNDAGPARLLLNEVGNRAPWLGLRLVGGKPARDQLGARVALEREGAGALWRSARTDASYCSASDPRVLFGLGGGERVSGVEVIWPSGRVERFPAPPRGRYTTLSEGEGQRVGDNGS